METLRYSMVEDRTVLSTRCGHGYAVLGMCINTEHTHNGGKRTGLSAATVCLNVSHWIVSWAQLDYTDVAFGTIVLQDKELYKYMYPLL